LLKYPLIQIGLLEIALVLFGSVLILLGKGSVYFKVGNSVSKFKDLAGDITIFIINPV
jgi:hypothetical protein